MHRLATSQILFCVLGSLSLSSLLIGAATAVAF